VQTHLAAARTQENISVNGFQRNYSFNTEEGSQPSTIVAVHQPLRTIADRIPSLVVCEVQPFNSDQAQTSAKESMCLRVLRAKEKEWGSEHLTTLDTVMELGSFYNEEGRPSDAKRMFLRALQGYEMAEAGTRDNQKSQEVLRKLEHVRNALSKV
jgi:hypothetical protein